MKYLTKFALPFITLITVFPGLAMAHPGHDQSMTFVHSFEAIGIVLAAVVIAILAIRHISKNR